MLYNKNHTPELEMELFKNPTSEYRGAPFWAWNCKLEKEELLRQIEIFKEMGFGGFHMHSRVGMDTEYLSEEFMDIVKACRDKAENENMLAWLYDEDRCPSGSAGGYVTKNKAYGSKMLVLSENAVKFYSKEQAVKEGLPYLLATFDIELENGLLKSYKMIEAEQSAEHIKRYAYVTPIRPRSWQKTHTDVDTMSREAIRKFVDVTYETYNEAVGDSFGKSVPAIFTDEPQVSAKHILSFSEGHKDVDTAWTTDFNETYKEKYDEDIISKIPEIFWDLSDGRISVARYRYHDHVYERFAEAYAKQLGTWCEKHGIHLTGHLMSEDTLNSQTVALTGAMRAYEWFGIPGIDILGNLVELATAKQAQSIAHQYGREAVLSELYGISNWDFDFRGHKFQGDWQAALGITVRVPHLSWASMKGAAKRDFPASINYQVPWHKEYRYVEDHFARLNTVLTRGKPVVNVGVIHPLESFWIYHGPRDTSFDICKTLDNNYINIAKWLADGMVEYDFISEALLPKQCKGVSDKLCVGEMNYGTILVPDCRTLRRTTFQLLQVFAQKGGNLIFAGKCPEYIDAMPTDEVKELYDKSVSVDFEKFAILRALTDERTVKIHNAKGELATGYLHCLRQDGDVKWFFLAHHEMKTTNRGATLPHDYDCAVSEELILEFQGEYTVKHFNTIEGTVEDIDFETKNGKTYVYRTVYNQDSLLLQLIDGTGFYKKPADARVVDTIKFIKNVEYRREEDNVVLLDIARYKFDDGPWQDEEEVLKIDKRIRKELNYPPADGSAEQPWVIKDDKIEHFVTMQFSFESEAIIDNIAIAGEEAEYIKLNGTDIPLVQDGYYTDKYIKRYHAGSLVKGTNIIEIKAPISKLVSLENYFLLGDFDVQIRGCEQVILPQSTTIGFGDITSQGMPFYGGNVIYMTKISVPESTLKIRVNRYRGALVKVFIDGKDVGNIVYPPYVLKVDVPEGEHIVEFKLYGNRVNTFGPIHDSSKSRWVFPSCWFTEEYKWSYEYEPRPTGIISTPIIELVLGNYENQEFVRHGQSNKKKEEC